MNTELKNYANMDNKEKHVYFMDRVINTEVIWGLFENGKLLTIELDNGKDLIPVWSTKQFAEHNAKGYLEDGVAEKMDLEFFVDDILANAMKNKDIIAPQLDYETEHYLWEVGGNRALKMMFDANIKKKNKWKSGAVGLDDMKEKFSLSNLFNVSVNSEKTAKLIAKEIINDKSPQEFFDRPPYWMEEDDPLRGYYQDASKLISEAQIIFGYVIGYEDEIFDMYPVVDLPVKVIFSMDPTFLTYPAGLADMGDNLDHKSKSAELNDIEKEIMEYIYDKDYRPINFLLPESLVGDKEVYLTTILIQRDHLKDKMLMHRLIPILADPEISDYSTLVPCKYWPENYQKYYSSENEVVKKK